MHSNTFLMEYVLIHINASRIFWNFSNTFSEKSIHNFFNCEKYALKCVKIRSKCTVILVKKLHVFGKETTRVPCWPLSHRLRLCTTPASLPESSAHRHAVTVDRGTLSKTMTVRDEATGCSALASDVPRSHPEAWGNSSPSGRHDAGLHQSTPMALRGGPD